MDWPAEPVVRMTIFAAVFMILSVWEFFAPRRGYERSKPVRWLNNLAITFLSAATVRIVLPVTAITASEWCRQSGFGLMNILYLPAWLAVPLTVIILDLAIYIQHAVFHRVPFLWHIHRMHHADVDFDLTTGSRFHPVEILISAVYKISLVALLGAPALGVLIFEVVLNAMAMFNHSNITLPAGMDRWLRRLVVTPDMHRVHHSVHSDETNANYGFNLAVWDRWFCTYVPQPRDGHVAMKIGLNEFRQQKYVRIDQALLIPFRNPD